MTRRLLAFITALCLVFSMVPVAFAAETDAGTYGGNIQWSFDASTGVLTLAGAGDMEPSDSGYPWLAYKDAITQIVFDPTLTSIGDEAFYGCTALKEVQIPDTVQGIGAFAFGGCTALESVEIADGVTYIGMYAFDECTALTNVTLPNTVTELSNTFDSCTALEHAVVPEGVTEMQDTFAQCYNLKTVELPSTLVRLSGTFADCRSLTAVALPEGLDGIGTNTFFGCISLDELVIPSTVTYIQSTCFCGGKDANGTYQKGVDPIYFLGDAPQFSYDAFDGDVFTKEITCYYPEGNATWTEDVLQDYGGDVNWVAYNPDNVPDEPEKDPYSGTCGENLTWSFDADTGVVTISGTGAMADYEVPNGSEYDSPWYRYASEITAAVVEEGVTTIGEDAFYWCENLTEVTLPSTLVSIGHNAFGYCSIAEVELPDGLITLGGFKNNPITEVVIPDSVTTISDNAFHECAELTSVVLPASLEVCGQWAFGACPNLSQAVMPEMPNFKYFNGYTFTGCAFTDLSWYTQSSICYNMFANNDFVKLEIPGCVTTLEDFALQNCTALTEVTVPASVTSLGAVTFGGCTALEEVYFLGDAPELGADLVQRLTDVTFYYPADNETWTADVRNTYDGVVTWVAYENGEVDPEEPTEPDPTEPEPTEPSEPIDPDDPYSGICGDDLRWTYNPDTRCLTISGTGRMGYEGDAPWIDFLYDINTLIVEEGVTTIFDNAFFQEGTSSDLTSVSLPSTLTYIGRHAFRATLIQELVIPDNVISIGEYAFSGCIDLVSVTLPSELETMYDSVFSDCKKLTQVIKPHMPWFGHLYENTFGNCTSLSDISWFNWDEIPAQTFQSTGVIDLTFHPQVDTIGNQAFQNCSKLTTITFHNGITSIGMETFRDCENLTTMYFEGDCPEFSLDCFKNVTATCYYPADNDTWTDDVLQQYGGNVIWIAEGEEPTEPTEPSEPEDDIIASGTCGDNLIWKLDSDGVLTVSGTGPMKDYRNPSDVPWDDYSRQILHAVFEEGVTTICDYAFYSNMTVQSVVMADTITEIGYRCFDNAQNLESVKLSNSLTYLPFCAFSHSGIREITIPDSVTYFDEYVFSHCANLTTAVLPDTLAEMEMYAFWYCTNLTTVNIPASLKEIPADTFNNTNIKEIIIPEGIETISIRAFSECPNLETVLIPDSVTQIAENAFESCPNLTIYCYNLSFAHMYAEAYGIPYQVLEDEPNTPVYNIFVTCGNGGTATIVPNPSPANRYVVLEVQPDKGYTLSEVRYQCVSNPGLELVYEQISDTAIVFFMPESDLEFEVYFTAQKSPFKDVKESDYFFEPVLWAVSRGITAGVSSTRFAPNDPCTRGQVVSFLWRAAGKPEPTSSYNPFKDVKESDYYYKAVLWAVENGITSGMSPTSFGPNRPCTRGQVVAFLYRAAGGTGSYYGNNPFKDVKESDYFYDAVLWAVDYGITAGMTKTTFAPNNTCTRGQVVSFLYRFLHG